uniref:Uncharacterized protein n=1 Tax=Arundo donax TaxID=35708 RepID=A0A0A9FY87_ARUDO
MHLSMQIFYKIPFCFFLVIIMFSYTCAASFIWQ